jgi:hypothetical protein
MATTIPSAAVVPVTPWGQACDGGAVAVFPASDEARWISICTDGGPGRGWRPWLTVPCPGLRRQKPPAIA